MIEQAVPDQVMTAPGIGKSSNGGSDGGREPGGAPTRPSIDRSASAGRGGSVVLVLLVAVLLVAAATAIVMLGGSNAEPYILAFLATLATVGVFSLFALACGILRLSGTD